MTVLDIGANIGYYSRFFANSVGVNGNIIAFEPDKTNFNHLKKNVKDFNNIEIVNKAVGERTGIVKLYQSKELNVDHQTYDSGEDREVVNVEMIAVDDLVGNNKQVDFIKIDIQGYDFFALKGMEKTIKNSSRIAIFGEFWPYALNKAGVKPKDYIDFLKDMGFKLQIFNLEKETDFDKYINDKSFYTDFFGIKDATN